MTDTICTILAIFFLKIAILQEKKRNRGPLCHYCQILVQHSTDPIPRPWSFTVSWTPRCTLARLQAAREADPPIGVSSRINTTRRPDLSGGVSARCHIGIPGETFGTDSMSPIDRTWKARMESRINADISSDTEFHSIEYEISKVNYGFDSGILSGMQ